MNSAGADVANIDRRISQKIVEFTRDDVHSVTEMCRFLKIFVKDVFGAGKFVT